MSPLHTEDPKYQHQMSPIECYLGTYSNANGGNSHDHCTGKAEANDDDNLPRPFVLESQGRNLKVVKMLEGTSMVMHGSVYTYSHSDQANEDKR